MRRKPQAFDLLEHLIRNRERVVCKDDLIAAICGGRIASEWAMTTCMNAARYAIGDTGKALRFIRPVPRKGIRSWVSCGRRKLMDRTNVGAGSAGLFKRKPPSRGM